MARLTREIFIPKASQPVTDPQSSAVAYIYRSKLGHPCAAMFSGKRAKPDVNCWFQSQAKLEAAVIRYFGEVRRREGFAAKRDAERRAFRHDYKPGDVLSAVWGYEQTNVDYYEVTATTPGTVTVRKIAAENLESGNMSGRCAPMPGEFIGEPMTRRPSRYGVKIDDVRLASRVAFEEVAGVRVYRSSHWSSYA